VAVTEFGGVAPGPRPQRHRPKGARDGEGAGSSVISTASGPRSRQRVPAAHLSPVDELRNRPAVRAGQCGHRERRRLP